MFFSLGTSRDCRFPHHCTAGKWVVSHDDGWFRKGDTWYKGFQHDNINYGNWTKIIVQGAQVQLQHGALRGYPLWWDQKNCVLTNLDGVGQRIWADETIELYNDQAHIPKVDIFGTITVDRLDLDQVVYNISHDLQKKISALAQDCSVPMRLFLTGGVDTLMLYAFARQQGLEFDLVDYEHFEYDWFTNRNLHAIQDGHWAYSQMHHWRRPTMFLTGSCGDEFTFRGPNIIALWCAWHDIDLASMLPHQSGYHVGYFQKPHNIKIFHNAWKRRNVIKRRYATKQQLIRQILDINANDHQHWHLGQTLTWTPFMDLEITKTMLRLDVDDLMPHILDAAVSKRLIQQADPGALALLSQIKNYDQRKFLTNAR